MDGELGARLDGGGGSLCRLSCLRREPIPMCYSQHTLAEPFQPLDTSELAVESHVLSDPGRCGNVVFKNIIFFH